MGMFSYYSEEELSRHDELLPTELKNLLQEVFVETGQRYRVVMFKNFTGWFRKKVIVHYELLIHSSFSEYQIFNFSPPEPDGFSINGCVGYQVITGYLMGVLNGYRICKKGS